MDTSEMAVEPETPELQAEGPTDQQATTSENSKKYQIRFLRRKRAASYKFVYPSEDDIDTVEEACIIKKLPDPIRSGGTARMASELAFAVDMSRYKNLR